MSEVWSILIVDGSDTCRTEVRDALLSAAERGYDFTEAENGAAALAALRTFAADTLSCVVLAYHLPDMDAPQLLEAMRDDGVRPSRPVLVLTDDTDRSLARRARHLGAMDCLGKRWMNAETLTRAVEHAVERHALLQERADVADQLRESDARARLAMDASATGIWDWNLRTDAVTWSPECSPIFGLPAEDFDGTAAGFDRLLFPADRERVWTAVRTAVAQRTRYEAEFRIVQPNGGVRWVSNSGRALYDEQGPTRMVGTVTDISERKAIEDALRESQQRLTATYAHAPIGIVELTLDGRYANVNDAFCAIVGYTRDELVGLTFAEITFEEDRERNIALFERLTAGAVPSFQLEKRFIRRDGTTVWVDVRRTLIRSDAGTPLYVIGAIVDINDRKHAEATLRDSEERFRLCLRGGNVVLALCDSDLRYVWIHNPHPDFDARLVIGKRDTEVADNEGTRQLESLKQSVVESRAEAMREIAFPLARGPDVYQVLAEPRFDSSGKVEAVVTVAVDVTARARAERALRESEQRLRAVAARYASMFETAGVSLWEEDFSEIRAALESVRGSGVTDLRTYFRDNPGFVQSAVKMVKVRDVNEETLRMFGAKNKSELLESLGNVFAPESIDAFVEVLLAVAEGRSSLTVDASQQTLQGRPLNVILTIAFPHAPDRYDDVLVSITDITDRKRLERDREHVLEREQSARVVAEAASRMKDEFLSVLSHELRTPLNSILLWSRTLARDRSLSPERRLHGLQVIERNARAQAQLTEDLLDLSAIVSGRLRLNTATTELCAVITAAVEAVRPAAEAKGVALHLHLPEELSAMVDRERIQQVVWNLLSNAIKFTPSGERVDLQLTGDESIVEIVVSDTGPGISADFLPHVFDRFRQADSSASRKHGGVGLGLAIVRELVEAHGGTVRVESSGLGQGTTFTVALPQRATSTVPSRPNGALGARAAVAPGGVPGRSLAGVSILVVDDDADTRELLTMTLARCGAVVTAVNSSAEALRTATSQHLDVMVADIGMPEEDGYTLIRRIRTAEKKGGSRLPALALTA